MSDFEELDELTQEYLKKILHYNPLSGNFTWLERPLSMFSPGKRQLNICNSWNSKFANKEAGSKKIDKNHKTSYVYIGISLSKRNNRIFAHRLVFYIWKDVFHLKKLITSTAMA